MKQENQFEVLNDPFNAMGWNKFIQAYDSTARAINEYAKAGATTDEIVDAIHRIHAAYVEILGAEVEAKPEKLTPAVPVRKSVTDEYIICLEDGKKFKSMKRHLRTHYNLTPEEYRAKWGLPDDYPVVCASYSARRSQLAKENGFGRK